MTAASLQGQEHPSPDRARVSLWSSWFALLAAPTAWSLQLLINSALAGYACYPHDVPLDAPLWLRLGTTMTLVEVVALAVCALAGGVGFRNWLRTRHEKPGSGQRLMEGGDGRTRFMAMSGMMISALFAIAIGFSFIHLVVLQGCGR